MDTRNEAQQGFMSTDDIPFHFLRRETFERFRDIWRQIGTQFMIYDRRYMADELLRLLTFLHFPDHTGQDIRILAIAGFYYYGESDIVVCYCCGLWRRNWTHNDEPWTIHRRLSVGCLFIRNNREVNRPYYGITERGLRNLEEPTHLLQQTTVSSGPSFVRSGHEIQAEIISGILRREQYNNRDIERVERHNILPVANLQRRETHVGDFHMGVEMRNWHDFHIDIESRTISIASENRTCNIPHLGRTFNTSELNTDIAQSHIYTPTYENSSDILESTETSIQRRYVCESEGLDEEADLSGVQNMHSTFRSVTDETDSGEETDPKQVVRLPSTFANNNFSRILSRSISEPLPYQYSYRTPRHIYTENTNCHDENHRCTHESADPSCSVTGVSLKGNGKHKEHFCLHSDTENATLLRAYDSKEREHGTITVSNNNTSSEEHDLEETILKRSHSREEVSETQTKLDSGDFADTILKSLVSECYDRTSDTGSGSGTLTTKITDTETTLIKNIEDQFHLPKHTQPTDSNNILDSSVQMQESVSNDEEAESDLTDRINTFNPKKGNTFCKIRTEDSNLSNELRAIDMIHKTESGTTGRLESEQAVTTTDSVVNSMETTINQDTTHGSFQSIKGNITQITEMVTEYPAKSNYQPVTNVESPKVSKKCLGDACNVSKRGELDQVDEVNDCLVVSSVYSISHNQDSYTAQSSDTVESKANSNKRIEMSKRNSNGIENISVLTNRHNGTLTSLPGQSITDNVQMQGMPYHLQRASAIGNVNESQMNDSLSRSTCTYLSKAEQECQREGPESYIGSNSCLRPHMKTRQRHLSEGDSPHFISPELEDTIFQDNEIMEESGRTEEQPPENLPVVLGGPENNIGSNDICLRSKMKVRQRHLSEGDSPYSTSLGLMCKPRKLQQNSTVDSRQGFLRHNSVSPSDQLAEVDFYSSELVDTIFQDNEIMKESGRAEEQPPQNLPVVLEGPESNIGSDDFCMRPKRKVRQRHLSEGDSSNYIPLDRVDTIYCNAVKDELGRIEEQPPGDLPVFLRGHERNIDFNDMCMRSKKKARQRHFSDGDSCISLAPNEQKVLVEMSWSQSTFIAEENSKIVVSNAPELDKPETEISQPTDVELHEENIVSPYRHIDEYQKLYRPHSNPLIPTTSSMISDDISLTKRRNSWTTSANICCVVDEHTASTQYCGIGDLVKDGDLNVCVRQISHVSDDPLATQICLEDVQFDSFAQIDTREVHNISEIKQKEKSEKGKKSNESIAADVDDLIKSALDDLHKIKDRNRKKTAILNFHKEIINIHAIETSDTDKSQTCIDSYKRYFGMLMRCRSAFCLLVCFALCFFLLYCGVGLLWNW